MLTQDFSNYINRSETPVQVECGTFEFTFSTTPGSVVLLVKKEAQPDVELSVLNTESLMSLANTIAMATRVHYPDDEIAVYSNIVSILRMLNNLLHNPVDYVLEEKYADLIERVKDSKTPLSITAGELVTSFTFSDNILHVKSLIPGKFCNTYHVGVEGQLTSIVDFIKDQYMQLDIQNAPTRPKIYQTLMNLSNDVNTVDVLTTG